MEKKVFFDLLTLTLANLIHTIWILNADIDEEIPAFNILYAYAIFL